MRLLLPVPFVLEVYKYLNMGVATSLQEITPKMNGQKRRPYVNCSQPLYFLAVQQPEKNRGLQSTISYPYAPVLPPGAPLPSPMHQVQLQHQHVIN